MSRTRSFILLNPSSPVKASIPSLLPSAGMQHRLQPHSPWTLKSVRSPSLAEKLKATHFLPDIILMDHSPAFSSINGSFAVRSVPNLTYLSTPFLRFSFVEVIPSFPCTTHNTVHCTILYPLSQPLSVSRTITFPLMIIYPISGLASDCLPTAPSPLPPLRTGAFSGVWLRKPFSKKA